MQGKAERCKVKRKVERWFCLLAAESVVLSRKLILHTLIHTFALETKLQYIGLNQENAEFLAPLLISQVLVLRFLVGKV